MSWLYELNICTQGKVFISNQPNYVSMLKHKGISFSYKITQIIACIPKMELKDFVVRESSGNPYKRRHQI